MAIVFTCSVKKFLVATRFNSRLKEEICSMQLANNIILTGQCTKLHITYILVILHSLVTLYTFGTKYAYVSNQNLSAVFFLPVNNYFRLL